MPMPLCHILRARLRQQGKGDKSTLPVRDNSTLRLQAAPVLTGFMEYKLVTFYRLRVVELARGIGARGQQCHVHGGMGSVRATTDWRLRARRVDDRRPLFGTVRH